MSRDPRIDPRPGDRLRPDTFPFVREVSALGSGSSGVKYDVGRFWYACSLDEWRRINAGAEVLHVAEEVNPYAQNVAYLPPDVLVLIYQGVQHWVEANQNNQSCNAHNMRTLAEACKAAYRE